MINTDNIAEVVSQIQQTELAIHNIHLGEDYLQYFYETVLQEKLDCQN